MGGRSGLDAWPAGAAGSPPSPPGPPPTVPPPAAAARRPGATVARRCKDAARRGAAAFAHPTPPRTCHIEHDILPARVVQQVAGHVVDAARDDEPAVPGGGVLGHLRTRRSGGGGTRGAAGGRREGGSGAALGNRRQRGRRQGGNTREGKAESTPGGPTGASASPSRVPQGSHRDANNQQPAARGKGHSCSQAITRVSSLPRLHAPPAAVAVPLPYQTACRPTRRWQGRPWCRAWRAGRSRACAQRCQDGGDG